MSGERFYPTYNDHKDVVCQECGANLSGSRLHVVNFETAPYYKQCPKDRHLNWYSLKRKQ